ncbi:HipA domain-containing protein [Brevundimonas sp. BAL450]|uniref:HipA domain-containing protein n=1 Tax=Brevundimonas sp. BAL450 TaxID=1708162 RepID=UPI0018CAA1C5|nr:HipA domain-containing protein [Brevundimonas sp. BAL450]MBG7615902.1 HipA domain-containing protein [Brevundimonas sp. BAL450]
MAQDIEMPTAPRIVQHPQDVVDLRDWALEDNPFGLQGNQPKRIFICPDPPPHNFLIGGHRYLFKEPAGWRSKQIWSEVIAYELSRDLLIPVPPAFLALGPGNGAPGVLIEFMYDHPGDEPSRYVDAIELLQGAGFQTNERRGSLLDNISLSRSLAVPRAREWWARTIAFDAVIGNTDRHSRNWGTLVTLRPNAAHYRLAPAFDNGTSLGYGITEAKLLSKTQPEEIAKLVAGGCHHYGWLAGDRATAQHAALCAEMKRRVRGGIGDAMDAAQDLSDHRIEAIAQWCTTFPFPDPFSDARADFVIAQLKARRTALQAALRNVP